MLTTHVAAAVAQLDHDADRGRRVEACTEPSLASVARPASTRFW
jgi:hypothetical protein